MKNLAFLGAFLLACSAPALGQTQSQTPDNSQERATRSGGSEHTLTGCLEQRGGKYVLMTNKIGKNQNSASSSSPSEERGTHHPREIELRGKTQDLQQHVGHTVSVTGTLHRPTQDNSSASANEPNDKDASGAQGNSQATGRSHPTMHVESVQMVSDSCQTGGSSSPQ